MGTSKYKVSAPGTVYHIYNRGNQKLNIFFDSKDYLFYLFLLRRYSIKSSFNVIAYCLMPNHIHLLVRQNNDYPPSYLMSRLHTAYAMYINRKYKKVGHLFQGRFKQKVVQRDEYLARLVIYLHLNPTESGLIKAPEEYLWSSSSEYQHRTKRVICDKQAIHDLGLDMMLKSRESQDRITGHKEVGISPRDAFDSP